MKASLINFFLLTALLSMMSCSAGKKNVSLKVSSSFALGENGFTGGLAVTGKSADGKTFSATTVGGKEVQVSLANGTWSIFVAGWDGSTLFAGKNLCGSKTLKLDSDTSVIEITVTEANCSSTDFTNGKSNLSDETSGFREIQFNTCSNLHYKSNTEYLPVLESTIPSNLSTGFCSGDLPSYMKERAHGVKVAILGENSELSSKCISMTSGFGNSGFRFPAGRIPVRIQLFADQYCSDEPLDFHFKQGLLAGSPDFDSVVNNQTTSDYYSLILPFNELRRGYSAMMNLLPTLRCNYIYCLPQATSPADYFLYGGSGYQNIKVAVSSCSDLTKPVFNPAELDVPASNFCEEKDGSVFLKIKPVTNAVCTSANCSITINGLNKTVTQNYQSFGAGRRAYDQTWRIFGTNATNMFYDSVMHNDRGTSKLDHVYENLAPGGPLSLFGNIPCSSIASAGLKEITLFEDGAFRKYQVIGAPSTKTIPKLLCNNGDVNDMSCDATTFDTKVVFRALENQIWKAREVIHLHCSYKIGMVERHQDRVDNNEIRAEKSIIGWNTNDVGFERMESFDLESRGDLNGFMREHTSSISRGQIIASEFKGQTFEWRSERRPSNDFREELHQYDLYSHSESVRSFTVRENSLSNIAAASQSIFALPYFSQQIDRPSLAFESINARSPNGLRHVRLWIEFAGGANALFISEFDGTNWSHPTDIDVDQISTIGRPASNPQASIDNNGNLILAWKEIAGANSYVMTKTRINNLWSGQSNNIPTSNLGTVNEIATCINGPDAAVVWSQRDETKSKDRIYASYSSSIGASSTWHIPTSEVDSISIPTENNFEPKCAIYETTRKLLVAFKSDLNKVTVTYALTTVSGSINWVNFISNKVYASPSGVNAGIGPYMEKNGNIVTVSYFYPTSNLTYVSTYNGISWTHPADANDGNSANPQFNMGMTKSISEPLSAFTTATATPISMSFPAYNSILKGNNLSLRELKPSIMEAKFTPYSNFIKE